MTKWRSNQRKQIEQEETLLAIQEGRQADQKIYTEFRMEKLKSGMLRGMGVFSGNQSKAREIVSERLQTTPAEHRVSIVVRCDVDGTLDAIMNCLNSYNDDSVELDILNAAVGEVTETDLKLAQDFDGIIFAFNIHVSDVMRKAAGAIYGTPIREHNVIYAMIDDLKEELSLKMPSVDKENVIGQGTVSQEFLITEKKTEIPVAGCRVNKGVFNKTKLFRINRGKEVLCDSKTLYSLKHHKEEVMEISQGKECGLRMEDLEIRYRAGDVITCYEIKPERLPVKWSPGF